MVDAIRAFMPSRTLAAVIGIASTTVISSVASAQSQPAPPPNHTDQPAEKGKEPDGKSKLVWLDAEGGVAHVNLHTFNADFQRFSVGFLPQSGTGPAGGAAVGLRFVFLTIGVRGRVASFHDSEPTRAVRDWTMSSLDGEVGMRVPLKRAEPYLTLAAGYTTFGGFGAAIDGVGRGMNVNGFNARLGFGFDYFVARSVSVGALGSAEILMLTRPGVPVREVAALPASQTADVAVIRALEARGSTYGTAFLLTGGVKVHF
jgi:hypothetical protein